MDIKNNLYTLILGYKNNTYVYQLCAKQEIEAQFLWVSKLDLNKFGLSNAISIKEELMKDANNEIFYPGLLNGLQSVWCSCVTSLGEELAIANIVNTIIVNKEPKFYLSNHDTIIQFSRKTFLYTIQLNYKGGTYVYQIFAHDPVDGVIKWIKQLDLKEIDGALNKNMLEIKNNLLSRQNDPEFIPQELAEFQSVWITKLELGDDIGGVTIVATQTNIISLPRSHD